MTTTLAVTKKAHKDYTAKAPYFEDCYYLISLGDAKTVKAQTTKYLPKLQSQIRNNTYQGTIEYKEYLAGAVWSEIPKESVNSILGEMFVKPSVVNLPEVFKEYISNITNNGNGLNILEALVTIGQLEMSRICLMAYTNKEDTGTVLPKVAIYNALDFFNWHQTMHKKLGVIVYDLVELRSQSYEMNPDTLEYESKTYYIIHAVSPEGKYYKVTLSEDEYDVYKIGGYKKRAGHKSYIEPLFKGYSIDYVPFVAINASNVDGELEIPVLFSQADLSVHAYKNSALFNKKLKIQTWALLALSGFDIPSIDQGIKADGVLPSKNPQAKAEYLTPSSESLTALKEAWESSEERAREKGIQISEKAQVESGIALEKRMKNQSNAFRRIAETRNEGILKLLSYICDWGSLPYTVENSWLTPYIDFNIMTASPDDLLKMAQLVNQGNNPPQDYFDFCKKHGYTQYEKYLEFSADLNSSEYQQ